MTLRPSVIAVAILSFIGIAAPTCNAWNSTAHEIIAMIASDHLSPKASSAIIAALRNHPRLNEDLLRDAGQSEDPNLAIFLRAATWPDMVRFLTNPLSHTEQHSKWHYVDFPFDQDGAHGPQPVVQWDGHSEPINLLQAMDKMLAQLRDPQMPKDRKAIDLCWVEHLVGDIHQPLHATSWFSKEYPQGDQGGNLVLVRNGENVIIPLHTYWDDVEGLSLDPNNIRKAADRIEAEHPIAQFKDQAADLSVVDWAKESFEIAKRAVYQNGTLPHATKAEGVADPNSIPALPDHYAEQALAAADTQVALAGYRLAAILEQLATSL
jgi:hypothetical protein